MILLHDAPEYVIGDMISPFKAVIGGAYKVVEARLLAAIHLRFGLPAKRTEEIRRIWSRSPTAARPTSKRPGSPASDRRGAALLRAAARPVAGASSATI